MMSAGGACRLVWFVWGKMVGVRGFEPPTSASRTLRAKPTALHPDTGII
mgnify:CR=1 FL=1